MELHWRYLEHVNRKWLPSQDGVRASTRLGQRPTILTLYKVGILPFYLMVVIACIFDCGLETIQFFEIIFITREAGSSDRHGKTR